MTAPAAQPTLIGISGPVNGETFVLAVPEVHIGRDEVNDICLPDAAVSRRHCVCVQHDGRWMLRDLASSNGTFVNDTAARECELAHGDRVAIGTSVLLFVSGPTTTPLPELADASPGITDGRLDISATTYLQRTTDSASRVERGLRALLDISTAINAMQTEDELHDELLRVVRQLTPAHYAAIVVNDPTAGVSVRRGAPGDAAHLISRELVTRVMEQRAGMLSHDPGSRTAYLCAPLAASNTVLGAIFLAGSGPVGLFEEDHLQLVTAVGRIAAIPLENVRRAAALQQEADRLRADLRIEHNMVGDSAAMRVVYDRISRVARTEASVLIVGETGTGKELAARAVHANSPRARRPFVAINCAAVPEALLENELFGHERGAYTGADTLKPGKLEVAQGGTLFLDEIGEMAPALQSKLLRALAEREFERVGGTRTIRTDVRVVSATNRSLNAEISTGRFRQDLFFRLNVVSIDMPALRDRRDDIPLLARHFLDRFAQHAGRRITGFSPAVLSRLSSYAWPGNARELQNVIERAVALGSTSEIMIDDLPEEIVQTPSAVAGLPEGDLDFHAAVLETKRKVIIAAFRRAGGSYVETAKLLAVHPNYLHRLIRNLELRATLQNPERP